MEKKSCLPSFTGGMIFLCRRNRSTSRAIRIRLSTPITAAAAMAPVDPPVEDSAADPSEDFNAEGLPSPRKIDKAINVYTACINVLSKTKPKLMYTPVNPNFTR